MIKDYSKLSKLVMGSDLFYRYGFVCACIWKYCGERGGKSLVERLKRPLVML